MLGSEEAQAIHAEHPAIDLHADTLMWSRWVGYDLQRRHTAPLPLRRLRRPRRPAAHARRAGWARSSSGSCRCPCPSACKGMARAIDEQIDALDETIARAPGSLRLVRKAAEIEACRKEGALAALLGIEGAHALEGDLDEARRRSRAAASATSASCTSASNEAGYPAYGRGRHDDEGLTPWGHDLVERCESWRRHRRSRAHQPPGLPRRCARGDEAAHREPHGRPRRVRPLAQHRRRAAARGRRQGRRASASSSARATSAATASSRS